MKQVKRIKSIQYSHEGAPTMTEQRKMFEDVTPEMVESVRLWLDIRANENVGIDIEELCLTVLKAAQPAPQWMAVPEGWQLVPKDLPSTAMCKARWSGSGDVSINEPWAVKKLWNRLLAVLADAAPQPDGVGDVDKVGKE